MSKKLTVCIIEGCANEAYYKGAMVCQSCYQFMYYWNKRSVTDKMKHVQKLDRWDKRAHALLAPANVTTTTRRRKSS